MMMNVEFVVVIIAAVLIVLERQMVMQNLMNVAPVIVTVLMTVYRIVLAVGVAV